MTRIVFHVGMGKTGSTAIQSALSASTPTLEGAGYAYLGQWMGFIKPEFDLFQGFQKFLRQSPEALARSAEGLLETVAAQQQRSGTQTFVISNEQYLENIPNLAGFFQTIAQRVDLQIIIFVRPPASWLPSAYVQWGVVHKTNPGPVQPFPVKARQLIRQYNFVRQWRELLGPAVKVLPFDEGLDAVQAFSDVLGVALKSERARHQVRPALSEIMLRAACNNARAEAVLPNVYNLHRKKIPPATPVGLAEKFNHLFDYSDIPQILAENKETLSYIERECGIDLSSATPEPSSYDAAALSSELLGAMLDFIFVQTRQIEELNARLDAIQAETARS